jgi:nucleoside-diphosphate-sugar epimerase
VLTAALIGGSGFVGKSVLESFAAGGLKTSGIGRFIVVARRASRLRAQAAPLVSPLVTLVDSDLFDLRSTFDADVVIHAAASSEATDYAAAPQAQERLIVDGTRHIIDLCLRSARRPRLLYVSSGAVYGGQHSTNAALDETSVLGEQTSADKAVYSLAKRHAEDLVREAALRHALPAAIARCFAFVGPWLPRDRHFAIGNFIGDALHGRPITVKNPAPVFRSYMFADDLSVWLAAIAMAASPSCPVFNVGSDEAVSITDLARRIGDMLGAAVQLPGPAPTGAVVDRYVPDVGLARRALGLTLAFDLQQSIAETVRRIRCQQLAMEGVS